MRVLAGAPLLLLTMAAMALGIAACSTPPESPHREQPSAPETPELGIPRRSVRTPDAPVLRLPRAPQVSFAELRVGMSTAEVSGIFPDPVRIETTTRGLEIWHYDFAQLMFRNGFLENWFNLGEYPPQR